MQDPVVLGQRLIRIAQSGRVCLVRAAGEEQVWLLTGPSDQWNVDGTNGDLYVQTRDYRFMWPGGTWEIAAVLQRVPGKSLRDMARGAKDYLTRRERMVCLKGGRTRWAPAKPTGKLKRIAP